MNVRVEANRYLSVACEPGERIVFDRKETKYHLLRDSAARLWDEICDGGTFEVAANPGEGQDPVALLAEAGLVGIESQPVPSEGITRRVWLRRTGKVSAAAVVLPLVASISTPRMALGQTNGPSLEEEIVVDQSTSAPLDESPVATEQQEKERTRRSERKKIKEEEPEDNHGSTGDNGTRTRRRTRTGQSSSTPSSISEETTSRTRTRARDR